MRGRTVGQYLTTIFSVILMPIMFIWIKALSTTVSFLEDIIMEAVKRIMVDLVNALLAERFFEEGVRGELLSCEQWKAIGHAVDPLPKEVLFFRWWLSKERGHFIVFSVEPAVIQSYRICSERVFEVKLSPGDSGISCLGPVELLQKVAHVWAPDKMAEPPYDFSRLVKQLRLSLKQTKLSLEALELAYENGLPPSLPSSLLDMEHWASFRDRPFHPLARAKEGWTETDYRAYSAEFRQPIALQWMAVKRQFLLSGSGSGEEGPAELLLSPDERDLLEEAFAGRGLSSLEYMAIPVHPWQMSVIVPREFRPELEARVCVPLDVAAGAYAATSSARSLSPLDGGHCHVKLPLGIVSLGAIRSLPALYMQNGERGQQLLEKVREHDRILTDRLFLCDETSWWAYMPENGDLFDDRPRHLSCLVRKYPSNLIRENGMQLIPMSALAVHPFGGKEHLIDAWLRMRGMPETNAAVVQLFGEICVEFLHLCLRLLCYGIMPEIHGQNVVLVLNDGKLSGFLLRDHDTIRLHLPWLQARGLADPRYIVKPDRPNSLYNETPEGLLFYLQTLGIQVNLYAILDALSQRFEADEAQLWAVLHESLEQAIVLAELPDSIKQVLEEVLLLRETWPWKQIIQPLLEQRGGAGGSMPSSKGAALNPFISMQKRRSVSK
jgi:siderophore synthetase component